MASMSALEPLLERLEELLTEIDDLDPPLRDRVFELLDGFDALHRTALHRIAEELGPEATGRLHSADPFIAWLLDAYDVGPPPPTAEPSVTAVQLGPTRR